MVIEVILTALLTAVLSGLGFWLIHARKLTTKSEVSEMIAQNNRVVEAKLESNSQQTSRLVQVLDKTNEVMTELKSEIAELRGYLRDNNN